MNLAIFIVIAAALALGIILRLAVTQTLQGKRSTNLAVSIRPIDVEAFRNLINPAEDEYLRRRLPANRFRGVRRERLRAMAAYVHVAGSNAAVLVRVGEAALATGDARIAGAAQQLVNDALLLRRNTTVALARSFSIGSSGAACVPGPVAAACGFTSISKPGFGGWWGAKIASAVIFRATRHKPVPSTAPAILLNSKESICDSVS